MTTTHPHLNELNDEDERGCRCCDKPISHGDYCSQYCEDVDRRGQLT